MWLNYSRSVLANFTAHQINNKCIDDVNHVFFGVGVHVYRPILYESQNGVNELCIKY